ncbi:MAG: hypothetical protein K2H28_07010 [Ruminococcus sp.]|nr:hypothetical protein [Ruminococcus sp.]
MAELKSFLIYYDTKNLIGALSDSQAGRLLKSLFRFAVSGETEDFTDDGMLRMAFGFMSEQIERDAVKYKAKCEKNKQIAIERERKRRERRNLIADNSETTKTESHEILISDTKKPVNVSFKEEQPESVPSDIKSIASILSEIKPPVSIPSETKQPESVPYYFNSEDTPTAEELAEMLNESECISNDTSTSESVSSYDPYYDIPFEPKDEDAPPCEPYYINPKPCDIDITSYDPYYDIPFEPKDEDAPPYDPDIIYSEPCDIDITSYDPHYDTPFEPKDEDVPPYISYDYLPPEEYNNIQLSDTESTEKHYYYYDPEDMPTPEEIEEILRSEQSQSSDLTSETEKSENLSLGTNNDNFIPSYTNVNERVNSCTDVNEGVNSYTDEDEIDESKLSYNERLVRQYARLYNIPITNRHERANSYGKLKGFDHQLYGNVNDAQGIYHIFDIKHSNRKNDSTKKGPDWIPYTKEDYYEDYGYEPPLYDNTFNDSYEDNQSYINNSIYNYNTFNNDDYNNSKNKSKDKNYDDLLSEEDYKIIEEIAKKQDKEALQEFINKKEMEQLQKDYETLKGHNYMTMDLDALARKQQEREREEMERDRQESREEFARIMKEMEEKRKDEYEEQKKREEAEKPTEEQIQQFEEKKRKMLELLNTTVTSYEIEWFVRTFNNICVSYEKVEVDKLTEADTANVTKIILGFSDKEIISAMCTMEESFFLLGKKNNGSTKYKKWKANFSWFVTYNHFMNVLNGTYDSDEEGFDLNIYRAFLKDMEYVEMNPDS